MLKNLFYKSFLIIQGTLGNKIKVTLLVDTYITAFGFIAEKFVKIVYKRLGIQLQCLTKSKTRKRFDNWDAWFVTYAIFFILSVENYIQSLALLFIIKLRQNFMIFGRF